jgi:hypothetical protein
MTEIITSDYFPGQNCDCEARSSYECGCDADWTPVEVYKLREDAKQLADRLTALELHSTSELARLEKERDDALSQIVQAECRAERFCQERDELIDKNKKLNEEVDDLIRQRPLLIEDFKRERDEARNAIVGWENKWKCAIDMAARAELERDEALKDAKNYHAKMVNLINEREDARDLAQQMSESNQVLQAEVRDYRKKEKLKP